MTLFKKFSDILSYQTPAEPMRSDEDMPELDKVHPFDAKIYQSLLLICCSDAAKHKNPLVDIDTYLTCWTQDLETQINAAGIDPDLFIAEAKSRLSSQSYSAPLLAITSGRDTTSLSSYKPIKTASPTSLF